MYPNDVLRYSSLHMHMYTLRIQIIIKKNTYTIGLFQCWKNVYYFRN